MKMKKQRWNTKELQIDFQYWQSESDGDSGGARTLIGGGVYSYIRVLPN